MRTSLSDMAIFEHQDLIAVVDRPQSVRNKHTRTSLLFQDLIDILQERLLRVCVEGRCLEESVSKSPFCMNSENR